MESFLYCLGSKRNHQWIEVVSNSLFYKFDQTKWIPKRSGKSAQKLVNYHDIAIPKKDCWHVKKGKKRRSENVEKIAFGTFFRSSIFPENLSDQWGRFQFCKVSTNNFLINPFPFFLSNRQMLLNCRVKYLVKKWNQDSNHGGRKWHVRGT